MAASIPNTIDRFIIQKILGKGNQGIVYLAQDPELNRQVAIKSVHLHNRLAPGDDFDPLLAEARTVSRLQNANIVNIFDIGMQDLNPYLVLEYIDGQSLQQLIVDKPGMDHRIAIMRDILSGVAAAHEKGIIHCDIKPANILISKQGQAKVADFGLAFIANAARADDKSLYGTPQYMAPEYIKTRQHQTVSDVFSIGLVCYELLTGQAAFEGDEVSQVLNAIANTQVKTPSEINHEIDERMDALLLKSLDKNPENRFPNAGAMLQALNDYLSMEQSDTHKGSDLTIKFMLRRMRHKKDFPAFSHTIAVLNQASSSETESLTTISNAILKDYSLTSKVLRLVNSAYYNRGGGKISTISRAVVMLGIDRVRSIAAALMLFEHMQNKMQASQLKEDAVQSLFGGMLASELAGSLGIPNHEEAFLCALMQQLGKMLVQFYLHEETQAIKKLMLQKQCSESVAVSQVLGTSYTRLGISVAREWGFPELITESMQALDFDKLPEVKTAANRLRLISQFSNALGACLTLPLEQQAPAIKTLTGQFSQALDLSEEKVSCLIEKCHRELSQFSRLIQFDLEKSLYFKKISTSGNAPEASGNPTHRQEFNAADSIEILEEQIDSQCRSTEKTLTDGIQDITNTLTGEYSINQVMEMILETIYQAMQGSRVVLCLKDKKTATIKARFGYGKNVEEIIEQFSIPLAGAKDVFQVAFQNNVDIRIDNTADEKIRDKIPDWYHQNIGSNSFTIFPIGINQSPIALIYIDSAGNNPVRITDDQLSLLKTLRNQAVLALKNLR